MLAAISPHYAVAYILQTGPVTALAVLAAVFLAVTGGEALYATWGTSGASRSGPPGLPSCCRGSC